MFEHYLNSCRVCLEYGEISIFHGNNFGELLAALCSIEIIENDTLPAVMCEKCIEDLQQAYKFKQKAEETDEKLRNLFPNDEKEYVEYLDSDTNIEDESTINSIPDTADDADSEVNITEDLVPVKVEETDDENSGNFDGFIIEYIDARNNEDSNFEEEDSTIETLETEEVNAVSPGQNIRKDELKEYRREQAKTQERKHVCESCGKRFSFRSNLENHRRVHSGAKPFECSKCGLSFAQKGHLDIHDRTHTGIKPYKCDICSRSFSINQSLNKHYKIHTGERPYSCPYCTKAFRTSYHLSNHVKRHLGEKNFMCDHLNCKLKFVSNSELKRHKLKHDKVLTQNLAIKTEMTMK